MNAAVIAVVVALCICIVVTSVGIFVTVYVSRSRPSFLSFRCLRFGSKRHRRRHRNREEDALNAKSREDIELLPLEKVMDRLKDSRAWNHYIYARQYTEAHPMDESEGRLSNHDLEYVIENGANAWEFEPSADNTGVVVRNCTEIEFTGGEQSLMANLQFPNEQRVYYYEVRLDSLPFSTNIAIGVAMKGYPPRRMAGWARNSIAYHTLDGTAYYAHPLHACRKALGAARTSDTIGVGWRPYSGKMFFAVNGAIVCHIRTPWANKRMYPVVSADGPCKLHVNVGARAFVLSHANMKHWGLAATEGARLPPPMYQNVDGTVLLAATPHVLPPTYECSTDGESTKHTVVSIGDEGDEFDGVEEEEMDDFVTPGYLGSRFASPNNSRSSLLETTSPELVGRRYSSSMSMTPQPETSRRNSTPGIRI
ncbi:Protein ssh4 [Coemansia sp. RSA 353]|nr:Protein ssh4 [Coemansia sp. RSA 2167]KAJ2135082.1 Protein ssh4 [Coemansia sp. RSA 788]KAJ2144623.1 Protein ssh4 [Coemansia sp. RSA 564]KAJ2154089.1 Protein ssh4 [Coemansia sp. RSA 637]KAJ2188952.1 Protein ssh4 [Coemansia sp. RSA 530]KAJ2295997.1 Protein ssh4 [Coemansia sp. RSA 353]KAJ2407112.1 Protein ssh4 [Coemansia sp. RSA 2526]KAJ2536556.1 Protein ssh4 [Coemansia sp. RSA 1935]